MKPISWLIILGCMVILQYHSIGFWEDVVSNSWIAYIVSPMVEILALFFWYKGDKLLAPLSSFIVIGSSLIHLSSGSIQAINDISKSDAKDRSIISVTKTLDRINDNNMSWWKTSQKSIDALVTLNNENNSTKSNKPIEISSIIIEGLMLIVVLIGQIKAIMFLRDDVTATADTNNDTLPKTSVTEKCNAVVDTSINDLAKVVLHEVLEFGRVNKCLSERSITKLLQLDIPDIGRIRKVIETGKGMSESKLNRILNKVREA